MWTGRWWSQPGPGGLQSQIDISPIWPPRGFGSVPTLLAWGSGVHRKHEEWEGKGELERVSAIKKIKQYKALFPRVRSILQSLLWSELRLGTVLAGAWYKRERSWGQCLNYRRFIKEKKVGWEYEKNINIFKNHFILQVTYFHFDPSHQKQKASLSDLRVSRRVAEVSWGRREIHLGPREEIGWDRMGWVLTRKEFTRVTVWLEKNQ